jgi:glycosyltransferase involved in cell wall biosynthesis
MISSLHFCTSDSWGGLELYAATLMAELKKSGCGVIAVCKPNSKIENFLVEQGVECTHLPSYNKFSYASLQTIKQLIESRHIDILHVHFHKDIWMPSMVLRNDRRRKLFLSIYMGVISKNDLLHRWIYKRVNAIFTSSKELNRLLPSLYPVEKEKIHFLPYGRDLERYTVDRAKRAAIRARFGVKENELLIGTMVRIDPGKGVIDFARSFLYLEQHRKANVKYLIVGEPTRRATATPNESPYEPHCEEYLRQITTFIDDEHLEGKIILAGYQDDLIGYLSAMDLFVFPSRDELYSLVVLDAMSMGLAVVAARAGGNLEQLRDGETGVLYNVGDSKDLAAKLTHYVNLPDERKRHSIAARRFVEEQHSMKQTIKTVLKFYNEPIVEELR